MNINTDRLIELSYEIEGLLLLARQKGGDTPTQLWQLISDKANEIAHTTQINGYNTEEYTPEPTNLHAELTAEAAMESVIPEIEGSTMATEIHIAEVEVQNTPTEPVETISEPTEELHLTDEVEQEYSTTEDTNSLEKDTTSATAESEEKDMILTEPAFIAETALPTPFISKIEIEQTEMPNENVGEYYDPEDNEDIDNYGDDNEDKPLTLDEKLAREQSRNLKKAFSLNDRFRFRRELFGNSDSEFADAINMVEAMESLNEANEYFYDDLQWDPENPEVIDFMQIITKHFQSR